jgi:membrane-associated phospholipid phosphatase
MESILQGGIAFIAAFQSLGNWLNLPMQFFSFLGSKNFFLLILPVLYWCVNADLGIRVGAVLLFTGGVNDIFKLALHGPRPYWYSTLVKALSAETSFGVPSGHAQGATAIWGMLAARSKYPWAWPAAIFIILMIGLSRLYLAVHFPHDVLLGWLLGGLILWAFVRWWDALSAWLKQKSLATQIGLAFALSLALLVAGSAAFLSLQSWAMPTIWLENAKASGTAPDPITLGGTLTAAGALFGLLAGQAWIKSRGGFDASGPSEQRAARFLLGLVGIVVFYLGLKAIFPADESLAAYILRYVRYVLLGLWIAAGAPYTFIRLKLAQKEG